MIKSNNNQTSSQGSDGSESEWTFEDAEFTIYHVGSKADYVTQKGISLAEDILFHNNFTELEMSFIIDLMKKHFRINKGSLEKIIKDDTQELTHFNIVEKHLKEHLPKPPLAIGCEGCLWQYNVNNGLYESSDLTKVEAAVAKNYPGKNCKKGSDYQAIARLVYNQIKYDSFFDNAPYGIPAESKFIRVQDDGSMIHEPYSPDHRQRYKLPADPKQKKAPLFWEYLKDTFRGPNSKEEINLLQQIMGGLVTGTFNRLQRAVLLIGNGNNGKSVLLELLGHMFPENIQCAISPDLFDNEKYRAELSGKKINIIGELDETKSLKASFKDMISCDTKMSGRRIYGDPIYFKPDAGHIFSSNHFPMTLDHSKGFYRRWVIIDFKNKVAVDKKISNLGAKIAEQELAQVLAWALIGAEKLAKNRFRLPLTKSHYKAMERWRASNDSVFGFLNDEDVIERIPGVKTPRKDAFAAYRNWCIQMGLKAVGLQDFYSRCRRVFSETKPSGESYCFKEMRLK